jgi:carbamoyl-phosphate synthase large subunit
MKIVINEEELESHVVKLLKDIPGNMVLLDHFLEGAIEAEADAICDGEDVYIIGIMQHIEPAGIHSGDSYAVLTTIQSGRFCHSANGSIYQERSLLALKHCGIDQYTICN